MAAPCGFKEVKSLKDALNLAAWLNDNSQSSLKHSVGDTLQEIAKRSGSDKEGNTRNYFDKSLENLSELCKKIVNGSEEKRDCIYSTTHGYHSDTDLCANNIAATFVAVLPRLHATLNYIWTKVRTPTEIYGLNSWREQQCYEPHSGSEPEETLFDFLTYKGQEYEDGYNTMLYGGYTREGSELSDETGAALETPLKNLLGTGVEDTSTAYLRLLIDALGLLSPNINKVLVSTAAILGTLGVGGAAAVTTNFMGVGTLVYGFLGVS
ncbi:DUF2007 domain-containing protein [Babesia caballi]|uniref:DUF2007 domain-containing protein n=1 Tax=Babesia caballi TaxID=5871 RepID=A0AAV4M050_BABCB|nr:DUF2007 domain-containing protein [Babesia caballi]